tara:strand:- start:3091 stop:3768 length:678 start_codon:yes stop_codon:yes gene_type:complete
LIFYGDSWCYSYVKSKIKGYHLRDIECGKSIPDLLGEGNSCYAKRRENNAEILRQIKEYPCVVFHTDPLRDTFIDWNSDLKPTHLQFEEEFDTEKEFDLMDVAKDRLDLFYSKLSGKDVILFSGASKVDVELAKRYNLKYIEKSATEILVGDFDDTPLFDYHYTLKNDKYLKKTFPNYKSKKSILDRVGNKNLIWKSNPELFSNRHVTEKGNRIISQYISENIVL